MWRFGLRKLDLECRSSHFLFKSAFATDIKASTATATVNAPTDVASKAGAPTTPPIRIKDTGMVQEPLKILRTQILKDPSVCAFDEVPGPATLQFLSRIWTYFPAVSSAFTAGALLQVLNFGKFFGNVLSWGGNLRFFQKFFTIYGPVVRLHGPLGGDVVLLSRPEHASIVFRNEGNLPVRSCLDSVEKYRLEYRRLRQAGPFLMSGVEWEKLHKTLEKPIQNSVSQHMLAINSISDEFVERIVSIRNLQEEVPKTFKNEILKWCLECMCSVTLNRKFGFLDPSGLSPSSDPGRLLDGVNGATESIRKCEYGFHIWKLMETPSWKSLVKHCNAIDGILIKYVEHAQVSLKEKNSASKMTASNMSVIESLLMKDDVLVEDVMTVLLDMLLIGANALAHSAAFLFYHLAKNPRCQKKLHDEIRKQPKEITAEALKSMKYLQACIKESLRLKPPIPILNRVLNRDVVIHKYFIPKGTYVLIATHLASLREEYFEDALKFMPERWYSQEIGPLANDIQCFASLPFGHGPKSCLAKELAEIEMGLLVVKVLKRFRIEYNYGEVESSNVLLASPNKDLKFTFIDRSES